MSDTVAERPPYITTRVDQAKTQDEHHKRTNISSRNRFGGWKTKVAAVAIGFGLMHTPAGGDITNQVVNAGEGAIRDIPGLQVGGAILDRTLQTATDIGEHINGTREDYKPDTVYEGDPVNFTLSEDLLVSKDVSYNVDGRLRWSDIESLNGTSLEGATGFSTLNPQTVHMGPDLEDASSLKPGESYVFSAKLKDGEIVSVYIPKVGLNPTTLTAVAVEYNQDGNVVSPLPPDQMGVVTAIK